MTPGENHAAAVARAEVDPGLRSVCDVCEGRTTTLTVGPDRATPIATPCPRCRGRGWLPDKGDPAAAPHVDVSLPIVGGFVRLRSASGGLESLWISPHDEQGERVTFDRATGKHLAASVRITPMHARALAGLLTRYADTHQETDDG